MATSRELAELRARLDAVDRSLLEAVRARNDIVRQIAEVKAKRGDQPLFDRTREREVYERADAIAREIGLSRDVARQIVEVAVEASHRVQESVSREASGRATGSKPRHFLIVGGHGRMGARFAMEFSARGHHVDVLEVEDRRDPAQVIGAADIVVLAVPMNRASEIAAEVAPFVRTDALLCDINSLKNDVCGVMGKKCPGEVLGLHPMFGSTIHSLRRQKVVVCPVQEGPVAKWLRRELERMGVELIESEPAMHDRMMAVVQVLVHFATIVMGDALRRCEVGIDESLRFTSPIYRLELAFVGRLFAQDPDLYAEIEMANPHGTAVRKKFLEAAQNMESIVNANDRDAFRDAFADISRWFHGFENEAMAISERTIDMMVRSP